MYKLLVQDKSICVPGEIISVGTGLIAGNGTYQNGENILANRVGLTSIEGNSVRLISLCGRYAPKADDMIICKVMDIGFNGWRLDTNSAYSAMLSIKDGVADYVAKGSNLTQYYDLGDCIVCGIMNVTSQKLIDVTMKGPGLRKLNGGRIIEVDPNKVPRIIGKQGSMVTMIKDATKSNIIVGQNGLIWIDGSPVNELLAIRTIRKIEKESHTSGLTEKIKEYLEKK